MLEGLPSNSAMVSNNCSVFFLPSLTRMLRLNVVLWSRAILQQNPSEAEVEGTCMWTACSSRVFVIKREKNVGYHATLRYAWFHTVKVNFEVPCLDFTFPLKLVPNHCKHLQVTDTMQAFCFAS